MGIIVNGFSFMTNRTMNAKYGVSPSVARSRFTRLDKCSSLPQGARPPHSYILAQISGCLASIGNVDSASNLHLGMSAGMYVDASLNGAISLTDADLGLISEIVAILAGTGLLNTPNLLGVLSALSSITSSSATSAQIEAINDAVAILFASGLLTGNTGGTVANISADITPYTTLSPESLSKAVWEYMAQNPKEGSTMEELIKKLGKIEFLALK